MFDKLTTKENNKKIVKKLLNINIVAQVLCVALIWINLFYYQIFIYERREVAKAICIFAFMFSIVIERLYSYNIKLLCANKDISSRNIENYRRIHALAFTSFCYIWLFFLFVIIYEY